MVLNTEAFGAELKKHGYNFFSGVPCSFLKDLINYAVNDCEYVAAANEGDAIAISAGAYLGNRKTVIIMQNSGLGNIVNPFTSLNIPFQIPVLGFVSLRGEKGLGDEPQHEFMGKMTTGLLDFFGIKWDYLSEDFEKAKDQVNIADEYIQKDKSYFFIVKRGIFGKVALKDKKRILLPNLQRVDKAQKDAYPTRLSALEVLSQIKDSKTILLATTGKTGRELYEIEDAVNNLYMVGSLGCVSSLGLGLALARPEKNIVAIDGDGSLLMRMGSLATNGYYRPRNLLHILLDNGSHDSTGGQMTVSDNVNFIGAAASFGYRSVLYAHNLAEFEKYLRQWQKNKQLTFLYIKIAKGSRKGLGRPAIKPYQVKERLKVFVVGS